MGRKKDEEFELTERVAREVEKEYGGGVLVDGASVLGRPPAVLPMSPALDLITSGGIEEGSWVGVTGNPKVGKTVTCLSFAASCQRPEHGSRPVYYLKAEGRLSTTHLRGIQGLDLSPGRFHVVQSREGRILTAQDFLRIGGSILRTVPGAVLIIDSVSALCDENELNADIAEQLVAPGNRLFARFVRTNSQVVPVNRSVVLCITHLIANIGKPGMYERAARAVQYQYDYMLRAVSKSPWEAGGRQVGLEVNWVCNTSRLGPPGMQMTSYLRFGVGIDRLYELVKLGLTAGLIAARGSHYGLDFLAAPGQEAPRFHGSEKLYRALLERPDWAEELGRRVRAALAAPRAPRQEAP